MKIYLVISHFILIFEKNKNHFFTNKSYIYIIK